MKELASRIDSSGRGYVIYWDEERRRLLKSVNGGPPRPVIDDPPRKGASTPVDAGALAPTGAGA